MGVNDSLPAWYLPRRWVVVGLSFFCTLIAYTMRANLSIAIVQMSQEFNWPASSKGLFLSAFFWGYIVTQLPGGMLARKLGPKLMMAAVIVIPSLFTLAIPFVAHKSAAALVACRVMTGLAAGPTFPTAYLMIGNWTPFVERAAALSFVLSGANLGTVVTDTLGPVIINHLGWQYVFYITGGIGFIWVIFWMLAVSNSPAESLSIHPTETNYILETSEHSKLLSDDSKKNISTNTEEGEMSGVVSTIAAPTTQLGNWEALKILSTKQSFWVIVFNGLCVNWGYYIFLTWLPTYANSELGFNLQVSGIVAITPNISMSVTGWLAGIVCDKLIARGYRLIVLRKSFFFAGNVLYITTLVLLSYMKELHITPIMAAVILAVGTTGGGLHIPGYSANIFDIAPNHPSIVVGVANMASTVPGIIGVYSTGLLLEYGAGWSFIWMVTAGFYAMAMITNLIFADVKRLV